MNNDEDLIAKLIHASNVISNSARRGCGNFVVTSAEVAKTINELSDKILEEARQKKFKKRKLVIDKLLKSES